VQASFDAKSKRYYVAWYHEADKKTKKKLWFYHGDRAIPFLEGKQGEQLAERMLAQMRGDYEIRVFRLEKYMFGGPDVIPYLQKWLTIITGLQTDEKDADREYAPSEIDWNKSTISPNTYKAYKGSIDNHLVPFFETHEIQLHEIQYDVLMELLVSIPRLGKGRKRT
jgi:hypothetical protein